jgi:hypothetical protein
MEQRNPEIKIGGGSNQVDLLKVIRQSYLLFWDHWLPENGPRVFGGMQSVATPLRSASSQSIESQESSSAESQQTLGSKQAIPDSEWIKHHSFTNHEQLGRRLFFDLEQDGKHGAVSYLLRSIMQTMPYQIDLKTKISAALQDDANTNESVNSCWTM